MVIPQKSVEISIRFWGRGERAAIGVRFYPKQPKRISTSRNIFNHCRRVARAYIYIKRGASAFGCEAEAGFRGRWGSFCPKATSSTNPRGFERSAKAPNDHAVKAENA